MKKGLRMYLFALIIVSAGCLGSSGNSLCKAEETERAEVTTVAESNSSDDWQQKNAMNMLNYIRAFVQEMCSQSGNRIYLEELYTSLLNNMHPNAVDEETLNMVLELLDSLEGYRMLSVNRERIQYYYEQKQALLIQEVLPDPLNVLSMAESDTKMKMILSVIYTALDTGINYSVVTDQLNLEYLQKECQLEEEGEEILHQTQKELFSYMINMVNSYQLDGSLALSEDMVDKFVEKKNEDNTASKIQFFESNQKAYQSFGSYWLELANCYYENTDYEKCLNAIESYEALDIRIFRKDYDFASVLPLAVLSAKQTLTEEKYIQKAPEYCEQIMENTDEDDWNLRYFSAQTYLELYGLTKENTYLERAYEITLNNVNMLAAVQVEANETYLADFVEEEIPKGSTKAQTKEIKAYNKQKSKERETELPPIYEPLVLNCDLLFALAEKLELSDTEWEQIDHILHNNGEDLFLVTAIDNLYRSDSSKKEIKTETLDVSFDGRNVILPAECVSENTEILVSVSGKEKAEYTDWELSKTERENHETFEEYRVFYKSPSAKTFNYTGEESVTIRIITDAVRNTEPMEFKFTASKTKRNSILEEWEWLDKASEWSDVVKFERESL